MLLTNFKLTLRFLLFISWNSQLLEMVERRIDYVDESNINYNTDDFSTYLGSGGFAELFRGTLFLKCHNRIGAAVASDTLTSIPVALKFHKRDRQELGYAAEISKVEHLLREADMLSMCSACPYIVHLYGTLNCSETCLILELGICSLYQLLYQRDSKVSISRIELEDRLNFKLTVVADCIQGLEFLHSLNVSHNDIKSDNLMLFPDGYFKLIDLGLAKPIEKIIITKRNKNNIAVSAFEPAVHCKGNPSYQAPEMFQNPPICSAASDVYGFVVLINEILTEVPPMHDRCSTALHPLQVCGGARPRLLQQADLQQYAPYLAENMDIQEVTKRLQHLIRTGWDPQMKSRPHSKAMIASLTKLLTAVGGEFRPYDMISECFHEQSRPIASNTAACDRPKTPHPPSPTSVVVIH